MHRPPYLVANERDLKTLLDAGHFRYALEMLKSFITLLLLAQFMTSGCATALMTYGDGDGGGGGDGDIDFKGTDESSDCGPQTLTTTTSNTLLDVNTLVCRVARLLRSVLRQLNATKRPIVLMRGLEIVPSKDEAPPQLSSLQATVAATATTSDTSVLGRFSDYLRTHELNIKFSDLLAEESERHAAREADQNGVNVEEGRNKKDKGGHGHMLMISIMFSKLLAVMTMGGISAVAMKALGIAMAALMMSSMHGLKAMHGHSKDEGHQGRRRRRNVGVTWASGGVTALPLPPGSRVAGDWERKTSAMSW